MLIYATTLADQRPLSRPLEQGEGGESLFSKYLLFLSSIIELHNKS